MRFLAEHINTSFGKCSLNSGARKSVGEKIIGERENHMSKYSFPILKSLLVLNIPIHCTIIY
jgi:hypothetical protein